MGLDRSARIVFDEVAEQYDAGRPGYPEPMTEETIALASLPPGGRILEVGCGPGKATLPFAKRGYAMLCLELGQNLATLAAEKCRPYPAVTIRNVAFEDWPLEERAFDLVLSAQAFHWIDPEIGFPKAAAALKEGGSLALWGIHTPGGDTPFRRAATEVHRRVAPQLLEHLPGEKSQDEVIAEMAAGIDASGLFEPVVVRAYPWTETYTTERYLQLLNSFHRIRSLPSAVRRDLLQGIGEVVQSFGGTVTSENVALLCIARIKR